MSLTTRTMLNIGVTGHRVELLREAQRAMKRAGRPATMGHLIAAACWALLEKLKTEPDFEYPWQDQRTSEFRTGASS